MKKIISLTVWLVFLAWSNLSAQEIVRTETPSNKYKYYYNATTDTIFTLAATVASGSSTKYYGVGGFLVGIMVGNPVASDTIIIKNATDTVAQIIQPSSGLSPQYYPIGARLDSSCIFIQKKTSRSTIIFRRNY